MESRLLQALRFLETNGDANILSRPITLQGEPYTVLGVLPPGFSYMDSSVELWAPIGFSDQARTPRGRWMTVLARLKPGVSFSFAQAEMFA